VPADQLLVAPESSTPGHVGNACRPGCQTTRQAVTYLDTGDPDIVRNALLSGGIVVAGNAGAGKTTLCRTLAVLTGLNYTEMDSLYFGPGWTKTDTFEARALALAEGDQWITEWQYPVAREALAARGAAHLARPASVAVCFAGCPAIGEETIVGSEDVERQYRTTVVEGAHQSLAHRAVELPASSRQPPTGSGAVQHRGDSGDPRQLPG
jgi:hypothetical protein